MHFLPFDYLVYHDFFNKNFKSTNWLGRFYGCVIICCMFGVYYNYTKMLIQLNSFVLFYKIYWVE